MKIYVNYAAGFAQEFTISAYLELEDDGRFYYSEGWASYGGGTGGWARGSWRQGGDTLFFLAERTESPISLDFVEGRELRATVRGDTIDFGSDFTLSLERDDAARDARPPEAEGRTPKAEEVVKPLESAKPPEAFKKKPPPIIATFHFKDGRTEERHLPHDPLFGLFTQVFYRLVDEHGKATNFFKLRQESKNAESSLVDFDEIDIPSTEESDEFSD